MIFNIKTLGLFITLYFLNVVAVYSQNYRNATAYIDDFEKNESFIQESLVEYSSSIIFGYKEIRTLSTLERIYDKLESINNNIAKNNPGFKGDTSLRDSFLIMNTQTIILLKNSTLQLKDYEDVKKLDFPEIFNCFATKKQQIINYYSLILDYTNSKRNFCKRNNIKTDKYFSNKNLFEYDAHQSLFFFKMNTLDAKLCDLLLTDEVGNVRQNVGYLNEVCIETLAEAEKYKKVYIDLSLNDANIEFSQSLLSQNKSLMPLYENYINASNELKLVKADKNAQIELRNEKEANLIKTKNTFLADYNAIKSQKSALLNKWYLTKSNFLKNNVN